MVDKIRRAIDDLEPPICPTCHIEMKWTQSTLTAADTIRHLFHCPNCWQVGEASSEVEAIEVPPGKRVAPALERAA
jgi:hypothetical protein